MPLWLGWLIAIGICVVVFGGALGAYRAGGMTWRKAIVTLAVVIVLELAVLYASRPA